MRSRSTGRGAGKRRRRRKKKKEKPRLTERWWPKRIEGRWELYVAACEWISQEYNLTIEEVDDEKWWSEWNRVQDFVTEMGLAYARAQEKMESVSPAQWQTMRARAKNREETRKQKKAIIVKAAKNLAAQLPEIEKRRLRRREQIENARKIMEKEFERLTS